MKMGGYLKLVEKYDDFEYPSERDDKAAELVKEGKIVQCMPGTFGYPAVYVYEITNER